MKRSLAILLVCCSALLGACSSSSTGPTNSTSVTPPGVGSWYKLVTIDRDTNNAIVSQDTEINTILSTSFVIGSYHDVIEFGRSSTGKPVYYRWMSNGDVMIFEDYPSSNLGITLPFGSEKTQQLTVDTTLTHGSTTSHVVGSLTTTYSRTDLLTVKGAAVNCQVTTFDYNALTTDQTLCGTTSTRELQRTEFWFAPTLKFLVASHDLSSSTGGHKNDRYESTVVDYNLLP